MAIAGAVSIAVLMAVYVAKLRRKETRFGCVGLRALLVGGRERPGAPCQTKMAPVFFHFLDLVVVASLGLFLFRHLF